MKKIGLFAVIAFLAIGSIFAQNQEREKRTPPETITVEGTLQLQNGMIAVKSGESVYYVPMLQRLVGFVEGLKEGSTVSIEGYASKNFLRPTKLSLSGKSYDFPARGFGQRANTRSGNEAKPEGRKRSDVSNPRHMRPQPKRKMGPWARYYMAPGRRQMQRPPVRKPDVQQQKP